MAEIYAYRHFGDRLLRRKDGVLDDPDWAALALQPDVVLLEVGGTATVGDYSVQVVPDPDAEIPTPNLVSFTRVAETNDGIATGLVAAFVLELDDTLARYYSAAVIATAAGLNFIALTLLADAPGHTLTLAAPAPGTLVATPDGYFPIAATMSNIKPVDAITRDQIAFAFVAVDSSGDVLPNDNTCTMTLQVVRVVERRSRYDGVDAPARPGGVTSSVQFELHSIETELRIAFDGGRFGVRISALANLPTSTKGIEVYYRFVGS